MSGSQSTPPPSGREVFGTRIGFVLAAVGSAVGLGNIWRFPYRTAEGGGAAFVVVYVVMTFAIGVPMMMAEFAVGRRTRLSSLGALRQIGGRGWVPLGVLFVMTSLLILAYLSVVAGWTLRYAIDAIVSGFSESPGDRFAAVSTGGPAVVFHLVSVAITTFIVAMGIKGGIERAGLILMPVLFLLLVGLAVWAATLTGAGPGYAFYLAPSLREIANPVVLQQAASQAFYSLSVGMGIMLTFASYLSRQENLNREAVIISFSDFSVAFIAGLVVFPVIFALGLSGEVSESAVGTLFISLPGAFVEMGTVGRVVGLGFFLALAVAALTSAVSLLEVLVAAAIDELKIGRRAATLGAGLVAAAVGVIPAFSQRAFGIMDKVGGEFFVVVGVLGMSVLVGWVMRQPETELFEGSSATFRRLVPIAMFLVRYVVPPLLLVILWFSLQDVIGVLSGDG